MALIRVTDIDYNTFLLNSDKIVSVVADTPEGEIDEHSMIQMDTGYKYRVRGDTWSVEKKIEDAARDEWFNRHGNETQFQVEQIVNAILATRA